MMKMHSKNEQHTGNNDLDPGINTNVFDILIETIGSEKVKTENVTDDSFALFSDFSQCACSKKWLRVSDLYAGMT